MLHFRISCGAMRTLPSLPLIGVWERAAMAPQPPSDTAAKLGGSKSAGHPAPKAVIAILDHSGTV